MQENKIYIVITEEQWEEGIIVHGLFTTVELAQAWIDKFYDRKWSKERYQIFASRLDPTADDFRKELWAWKGKAF